VPRLLATSRTGGRQLISLTTMAATTATYTSPTIGKQYVNLQLIIKGRSSVNALTDIATMRFNADSGTTYEWGVFTVNNSGTTAAAGLANDSSLRIWQACPGVNAAGNVFGRLMIDIPGYTDVTALAKQFFAFGAGPSYPLTNASGQWIPTQSAAITSITVSLASGSWLTNSTFYLYGLT
jgi:hypothetical protein